MVAVVGSPFGFCKSNQVWKGGCVEPSAKSQRRFGPAMPVTLWPSKLTYIARSAKI